MGKQRTVTGAYSEQTFGGKGAKDKPRNVDIGPAQGVVKNPYATKTFEHLDAKAADGTWDAYFAGFSGPVPSAAGKVVKQGTPVESQNLSDKFLGPRSKPGKRWE
jgi:hypothetical protein